MSSSRRVLACPRRALIANYSAPILPSHSLVSEPARGRGRRSGQPNPPPSSLPARRSPTQSPPLRAARSHLHRLPQLAPPPPPPTRHCPRHLILPRALRDGTRHRAPAWQARRDTREAVLVFENVPSPPARTSRHPRESIEAAATASTWQTQVHRRHLHYAIPAGPTSRSRSVTIGVRPFQPSSPRDARCRRMETATNPLARLALSVSVQTPAPRQGRPIWRVSRPRRVDQRTTQPRVRAPDPAPSSPLSRPSTKARRTSLRFRAGSSSSLAPSSPTHPADHAAMASRSLRAFAYAHPTAAMLTPAVAFVLAASSRLAALLRVRSSRHNQARPLAGARATLSRVRISSGTQRSRWIR